MRLSSGDPEKWENRRQEAADMNCNSFMRILLTNRADCRRYRMACTHSNSTVPNAYDFGNITAADEQLTQDLEYVSAWWQVNTAPSSPILQTEFDAWLRSGNVGVAVFEAILARAQARVAPLRTGSTAQRSDAAIIDRLASESSSRGTASCLPAEMHQGTEDPVQDEQLSHKKQGSFRNDTDARLQALLEEQHSLQAALRQSEAKAQTQRLGRPPTPGAAQTAPPVGPETAHAPAASAMMRPVQQDPAMGALATHLAIMESTPPANVV